MLRTSYTQTTYSMTTYRPFCGTPSDQYTREDLVGATWAVNEVPDEERGVPPHG